MKRVVSGVMLFAIVLAFAGTVQAQSVYELRKLTQDEWLSMSTEERLAALGKSYQHDTNQTFLGSFGEDQDLYKSWGYEFYEMEDRYQNYSFRNYEPYNIIEERRRKWSYNSFGDRISKMRVNANIWREIVSGTKTSYVDMPYKYINSSGKETAFIDGVWVAREGTDDWAVSITGAGALRTAFTPLTLSLPNMDGFSIDFQSKNTQVKLISSVPLGAYGRYELATATSNDLVRRGGVMLRGGRMRHKFGVLTLGATYATSYGVQGNRQRGNEWRGTVSNYTPTPMMVAVRFLDDSPNDNEGGPVVYDIRLKINGKFRDDIIPSIIRDDVSRDRISALTDILEQPYIEPKNAVKVGGPEHDFHSVSERIYKYADYIYLNDYIRGNNIEAVPDKFDAKLSNEYYELIEQAGKPLSADGTEMLVYTFDIGSITDTVYSIEAVTTVANDYRIQTAMIYTLESSGGHDSTGKPTSWYNSTYWRTVAQCDGNIKDKSNIRTVTLNFGFQVATVLYGLDADFNYRGFKIRGEFVKNDNHYMFAEGAPGTGSPLTSIANQEPRNGGRFTESDNAYYLVAQKDWEMFGFNAEIFKMGKNYKPYMDYFNIAADDAAYGTNAPSSRNRFSRVNMVEDNDDGDSYPDTMLTQRTVGYRILSTEDPDGVFPGNDADNDGISDNNKNNNSLPDYDEPFFMFDIDPDDFVFGNDYNNNTVPDFREDDMKLDTPYDLDRQGHHYFFRVSPIKTIDLIAGSMKTGGVGTSSKTDNDYVKAILNYDVFHVGKLYAEYRYEKIKDNFRDPYIRVKEQMKEQYLEPGIQSSKGRYERDLYFDELEYRNSSVNRLFLESKIRAVPSITLENHIRFERNEQIEGDMYDGSYQPFDVLSTMAMVNKIVYTRQFGNFVFSPGVKFRLLKKVRSESLQPLDHYLMRIPLVMLKYIISDNTDIALGFQGLPGLPLNYVDYVQSQNDYERSTYTLQLQNHSGYFGYRVWGAIGYTFDQFGYQETDRQFEDYKTSSFFVKMNLGW